MVPASKHIVPGLHNQFEDPQNRFKSKTAIVEEIAQKMIREGHADAYRSVPTLLQAPANPHADRQ